VDEQLSVWHLVTNAGIIVQSVMLLLLAASILSWGLIFQRIRLYRQTRQAQASFEERFWSGMDLGQLYKEVCASPRLRPVVKMFSGRGSRNSAACASRVRMGRPSWTGPSGP